MKIRPAWQIIISALETGMKIRMNDQLWVMKHADDGRPLILIEMKVIDTNEPHHVDPKIPLNAFIALCAKLPEQELHSIAVNTSFVKWQQSRVRQRS